MSLVSLIVTGPVGIIWVPPPSCVYNCNYWMDMIRERNNDYWELGNWGIGITAKPRWIEFERGSSISISIGNWCKLA